MEQTSLFQNQSQEPLASRLRPQTFQIMWDKNILLDKEKYYGS